MATSGDGGGDRRSLRKRESPVGVKIHSKCSKMNDSEESSDDTPTNSIHPPEPVIDLTTSSVDTPSQPNEGPHRNIIRLGPFSLDITGGRAVPINRIPVRTYPSSSVHVIHGDTFFQDDRVRVRRGDIHIDDPESPNEAPPISSTNEPNVIVVDSGSDSEEETTNDVIVVNETPVHRDDDDNNEPYQSDTFGTTTSTRTLLREQEDRAEDLESIISENMDTLATSIRGWTPADARRFLMITVPQHAHSRSMSHRLLERQMAQLHPTLIISAIMGSPAGLIGSSIGSYEDLLELAEQLGPGRPQGLTDEIIASLPVKPYHKDLHADPTKLSCVVCMTEYEENEDIKVLPCSHEFHVPCIDPWLKEQKTCPICRTTVTTTASNN